MGISKSNEGTWKEICTWDGWWWEAGNYTGIGTQVTSIKKEFWLCRVMRFRLNLLKSKYALHCPKRREKMATRRAELCPSGMIIPQECSEISFPIWSSTNYMLNLLRKKGSWLTLKSKDIWNRVWRCWTRNQWHIEIASALKMWTCMKVTFKQKWLLLWFRIE